MEYVVKQMRSSLLIFVFLILFLLSFLCNIEGYYLFVVLGIILYYISESIGKEIYFIIPIIIISIAAELVGSLFLVDYFNFNGLNPLKIHPFTITWLTIYFIEILRKLYNIELNSIYSNKKIKVDKIKMLGYLLIVVFGIVTLIFRGLNGMPILFECYLGPITFFLYMKDVKLEHKKVKHIFYILLFYGVFLSLIGNIEYCCMDNPIDFIYSKANWITDDRGEGYRIKTLLGNPLVNASFFLFLTIVTQIYINNIFKYFLMILFLISIVMTGSRSFMIFGFISIIYNENIFRTFKNKQYNYIYASIITIICICFFIVCTPIGRTIITRFYLASNSVEARLIVIKYFINNITNFNLHGLGSAATELILYNNIHQPIIIEIPWVILFYEVGHFVWLYVLFLGVIVVKLVRYKYFVIIFILSISTFISFGIKMPINYLLYLLLTISILSKNTSKGVI
jgi:hypothetical protein